MKTVSAAKIAAQFDEYLAASRKQPVLVTQNGKPVAVLLAIENRTDVAKLLPTRSLRAIFQKAQEQIQQGAGISAEFFWRQVEQSRRAKRRVSQRSRKDGH